MDLSNFTTLQNLEAAFGGESMANRKYLFFADVARQLGFTDLAKLFKETADQETEHAFAHFKLLHPELVVEDAAALTDEQKREIVSRCLSLAIEGETYEYTTMYPEFAADANAMPMAGRANATIRRLKNFSNKFKNLPIMPTHFGKLHTVLAC
ncbi:MAG: hypothetical protein HWQ43_25935 [Nostoc sp. JL31]|nr:hypothetical protein [Nostoc sp. JL31]